MGELRVDLQIHRSRRLSAARQTENPFGCGGPQYLGGAARDGQAARQQELVARVRRILRAGDGTVGPEDAPVGVRDGARRLVVGHARDRRAPQPDRRQDQAARQLRRCAVVVEGDGQSAARRGDAGGRRTEPQHHPPAVRGGVRRRKRLQQGEFLRAVEAGLLVGGLVVLALVLVAGFFYAGRLGLPGPGPGMLLGHVVAAVADFYGTDIPAEDVLADTLDDLLGRADAGAVIAAEVLVVPIHGRTQFLVSGATITPHRDDRVALDVRPHRPVPQWRRIAVDTTSRAADDLAARELAGDLSVTPVRGQIVRVGNPGLTLSVRDEHHPGDGDAWLRAQGARLAWQRG